MRCESLVGIKNWNWKKKEESMKRLKQGFCIHQPKQPLGKFKT